MGNKTGKIKPLFIIFCFLVKQTEGYHQRFLNPSLRCPTLLVIRYIEAGVTLVWCATLGRVKKDRRSKETRQQTK